MRQRRRYERQRLARRGHAPCTAIPATFTSIYDNILNKPSCNPDNICHGSPAIGTSMLSFKPDKAAAYTALQGDVFLSEGRRQGFTKRVVAGSPDMSFLYVKVANPDPPGDKMPLVGDPLNDCELETIRTWITNGAMND